jgi:hypothetical protein
VNNHWKRLVVICCVCFFTITLVFTVLYAFIPKFVTNPVGTTQTWLTQNFQNQKLQNKTDETIYGTSIEVVSKIPNLNIARDFNKNGNLFSYLTQLNLLPLNEKVFSSEIPFHTKTLKRIIIEFHPIDDLPKDEKQNPELSIKKMYIQTSEGKELLTIFNNTLSNNYQNMTIPIYVNQNAYVYVRSDITKFYSRIALFALFLNFHTTRGNNPDGEFATALDDTSSVQFLTITEKQTFILPTISSFLSTLRQTVIPKAHAIVVVGGTCYGTYTCGPISKDCACKGGPYDSGMCNKSNGNKDCEPGGTCECTDVCGDAGPASYPCGVNSGGEPNQCVIPCSQGVGYCVKNDSCTSSPPCTWGGWVNGSCGVGSCLPTQRQQTRSTNPAGCASSTKCVDDATCVVSPPTCNCSGWSDAGCGAGGCPGNMMYQTQSCNPAGCAATTQCSNSGCAGCNCNAWVDVGCGQGGCPASQMYQTRGCNPGGCSNESQCVPQAACTPMTISVRAVQITTADISCAATNASTDYLGGTQFSVSPAGVPATQTQIAGNYVSWNNLTYGTYTVNAAANPLYSIQTACWTRNPAGVNGQGLSVAGNPADTITMNIGYSPLAGWMQAQGGDAIACTDVKSEIYAAAVPRQFITNGNGGYPGVASYNGTYDFNNNINTGETYVSNTNWMVKEAPSPICSTNWFQYFYNRFDMEPKADNYAGGVIAKPGSGTYKVGGDATVSGWNVNNNDSIVMFVNGNLTIDGDIRINGSGFVAFVVSGNIQITSNVGNNAGVTTPNIEGIYITSGSFMTGQSTAANRQRFVVSGTVVANTVILQRDLTQTGGTNTVPAELFQYNPALLFRLPDEFKDVRIKWQEVAP